MNAMLSDGATGNNTETAGSPRIHEAIRQQSHPDGATGNRDVECPVFADCLLDLRALLFSACG
ncbi:MAG: hypothetical protein KDA79_25300, partial [Planctomycetaceae bacterium]|nr:hypothetical protein [Planctomycetaceae bacterium]